MRKPVARKKTYPTHQMSRAMQMGPPIWLLAPKGIVSCEPRDEADQSALKRLEAENAKLRRIASEVLIEIEALRRVS
jgi:hypothetical protein